MLDLQQIGQQGPEGHEGHDIAQGVIVKVDLALSIDQFPGILHEDQVNIAERPRPVKIQFPGEIWGPEGRQHQHQEKVKDEKPEAEFWPEPAPFTDSQKPDNPDQGKEQEVKNSFVQALQG